MDSAVFAGGPRSIPLTTTFAAPSSTLPFIASLTPCCSRLQHSHSPDVATVAVSLEHDGETKLHAKYVTDGDMEAAPDRTLESCKAFFNQYSAPSFDGDFTTGVILYDGGSWPSPTSLRFVNLQSALTASQLSNFKSGANGGGGTPVSLRPCLSPKDAVEVLESEVQR